jgi:hypothetical protein
VGVQADDVVARAERLTDGERTIVRRRFLDRRDARQRVRAGEHRLVIAARQRGLETHHLSGEDRSLRAGVRRRAILDRSAEHRRLAGVAARERAAEPRGLIGIVGAARDADCRAVAERIGGGGGVGGGGSASGR